MIITFQLIAGVAYPTYISAIGFAYIFARIIYSQGYLKSPKGRVPGALLMDVLLLAMVVLTVKKLLQQEDCCCIAWIIFIIMFLCLAFGFIFIHPK